VSTIPSVVLASPSRPLFPVSSWRPRRVRCSQCRPGVPVASAVPSVVLRPSVARSRPPFSVSSCVPVSPGRVRRSQCRPASRCRGRRFQCRPAFRCRHVASAVSMSSLCPAIPSVVLESRSRHVASVSSWRLGVVVSLCSPFPVSSRRCFAVSVCLPSVDLSCRVRHSCHVATFVITARLVLSSCPLCPPACSSAVVRWVLRQASLLGKGKGRRENFFWVSNYQ